MWHFGLKMVSRLVWDHFGLKNGLEIWSRHSVPPIRTPPTYNGVRTFINVGLRVSRFCWEDENNSNPCIGVNILNNKLPNIEIIEMERPGRTFKFSWFSTWLAVNLSDLHIWRSFQWHSSDDILRTQPKNQTGNINIYYKVNRCLARYSPRHNHQPTHQ